MLSAILLKIALELTYINLVNPIFEYSGFILDSSYIKYYESWVIYFIAIRTFPCQLKKPSDYFLSYLLYAFLAPLLVFYGLANASREHLYIVILGVIFILAFRGGKKFHLPQIKGSRFFAITSLVSGIFIVTAWMLGSGGLQFFNLNLLKVYEFREDSGNLLNQGIMSYLNVWTTKVFGPALLAYSLWKKKYWLSAIVFLLHVLWFGISSHKGVLFYPFLVTFLWIWFSSSRALALIPLGMSFVVIFSYFIYLFFDQLLLGSLFIRRAYFVPSYLTFIYYDFFSNNNFIYWSNSFGSAFSDYPYNINPAKLIGEYIDTDASANNSFLSTGYMHAGIAGVVFYGIIVGVLFRLIDNIAASGIPTWVAISILIVPSQSMFISADLPTSLLTHGFGVAVVLLFLMRSSTDRKINNKNINQNKFSADQK